MDAAVIAILDKAGIDTRLDGGLLPRIGLQLNGSGRLEPLDSRITVEAGAAVAVVEVKTIPQLFAGDRVPPDFERGPPPAYLPFFLMIETTAVACCAATSPEYDRELERLYAQLRRRPLATDANPIFSYLRAAVRLYMSIRNVSQAELAGVAQRLSRSAGHFSTSITSTNYIREVGGHLFL
jgi:hypothetical protein